MTPNVQYTFSRFIYISFHFLIKHLSRFQEVEEFQESKLGEC